MKIQTSLTKLSAIAALAVVLSTIDAVAATFTVTNAKDSGAGSLRDVIAQANADGEDDTINFDPAFFNVARTITLASEIQITADGANPGRAVTFNGPGASLLTISGNNVCRPFFVDLNSTVAMSGLTVRDGNGVGTVINLEGRSGGAFLVHAGTALTLTNVTIRNNTVANSGGGIFLNGARNFTVSGSLFTENNADFGGGIVDGGSSVKTVVSTTISNNAAISGVGGASFDGLKTTISNCLITGNSAGADPNVVPSGGAGSIGGLGLFATNATVTDTTISNNVAGLSPTSTSEGRDGFIGGVSVNSDAAIFRRVTVSGNTDHSGATAGAAGMQLTSFGTVEVIDSVVSNNRHLTPSISGPRAPTLGGGIVTVSGGISIINTTIAGNVAENGIGGGIWVFSDGLKVINSTITGNVSELGSSSREREHGGGGIFIDERITTPPTIQNSIIAGNTGPTGPDVTGEFISAGYNLIGDTANSTGFGATGDQLNVDPLLDPVGLADNGGLTLTIALQSNSPAIDKGKSAEVMTDQRALPRPFNNTSIPNAAGGDGSDIGAFEDQPANTAKGSDVTVSAPAADATVTFNAITKLGFTTFAEIIPASAVGNPPAGYTILDDAPAYDIHTTATFTAPITVCFTVNSVTDAVEFARVRILHGENGALVDRTDLDSIDFATHTVCAQVDSLSPFVVALAPVVPNRPLNIATRMDVGTGDQVLIGGFIITGIGPKNVIFRAIGPSLADAGLVNFLADPNLELHNQAGDLIASNDDWKSSQKGDIIATGLAPQKDKEAAILATLDPGQYTAIVRGKGVSTGIGLVEGYDLDGATGSEFANISTRGFVQTADKVMIGGFILGGGAGSNTILVRALGPSLTDAGVADALADPTLELRDANGDLVQSNDNWMESAQQAEIESSGLAPKKNKEAAVLETLPAGNYTAIVAGQNGGIGVGLVEVYRLE